ncbi:MAG TPA: right-handed parallel beta-helix repeat-containing protein, partial [Candidatus Cloacimonadota bacterium]|nr:right-handed parallel beta-helix repeat-containing protein [Candidatus Cloacimonadota bacterium]
MTKKTCLLVFLTLMLGMFSAAWAATINVPGNHATIQAAIDAASDGDEIQIAAGTYNEHVIINKAISLLGPNANISAVDGTRVPEAVIGQYITVNNGAGLSDVIIAGFEFNETDAWHSIIMIGGNTEDVQILNNRFINIPWKAIYTEAGANVTNLDMIISGNLISGVSSNSESGIYLINHTGGTISNNKIENTVYGGILINTYCHGMTISNNQIYNVPQQGLQLSGDVADVTVSGNIIDHANTAEVSDKGGI